MNNTIIKILSIIAVICFSTTALMMANAEDGGTLSSGSSTVSSDITSSSVSSDPVSSDSGTISSNVSSSEGISTSSETTISSETSSVVSSEVQSIVSESSTSKTSSKESTSSKTSSKKKKSKKSSSKKSSSGSYTPNNYNNGYESISGEWEGGQDKEEPEKEVTSTKELSKHITNPKKVVQRWIWLPVLIGIGCVGVLIYTNMYLFKNGKHTKAGVQSFSFDYADEEPYEAETEHEPEKSEDDPFSAENFFNFDDE